MGRVFRGAMHVHTTFSDGELTLSELRRTFESAGCQFLFVSDHADSLTLESVEAYRRDCAAWSDDRFVFVPSLEYTCDQRMHILGYGATALTTTSDPEEVIRHIRAVGGIAVIAHPKDTAFEWIESFTELPDGIEVWNSKYDGKYAPRPQTFRLLHRLEARRPSTLAFYGQDYHWRTQPRVVFVNVEATSLTPDALRSALGAGAFEAVKGDLHLPANGAVNDAQLAEFGIANARSRRVKRLLGALKNVAGSFGATVPEPLKAHLRRYF